MKIRVITFMMFFVAACASPGRPIEARPPPPPLAAHEWNNDAKLACALIDASDRVRCVVQHLVDSARARRDVVALLCAKDKLDEIDAVKKVLASHRADELEATYSAMGQARIEQLGQDAEYCVGEELAFIKKE